MKRELDLHQSHNLQPLPDSSVTWQLKYWKSQDVLGRGSTTRWWHGQALSCVGLPSSSFRHGRGCLEARIARGFDGKCSR